MTAKNILIITGILFSLLLGSQEGWSETVEIKIIKSTFIPTVLKLRKAISSGGSIQRNFYIR